MLICILSLVFGISPFDDPWQSELDKLQGTWVLESYTNDGKTTSADERGTSFRGQRLIVKGNHWVERYAGTPADIPDDDNRLPRLQFAINPSKVPARVDIWPANRPDGWRRLGIYKLEGDKLTICFRILLPAGDDVIRPTEFGKRRMDDRRAASNCEAIYKRAAP